MVSAVVVVSPASKRGYDAKTEGKKTKRTARRLWRRARVAAAAGSEFRLSEDAVEDLLPEVSQQSFYLLGARDSRGSSKPK